MGILLTVDELIAKAQMIDHAGAADPRSEIDGLSVLSAALDDEADLTPAGRNAAYKSLSGYLETRLRAASLLRRHPMIADLPIERPIFVTGQHRSGTTLLHRMLAAHPGLRAPQLWEQLHPAHDGDVEPLIQYAQSHVDEYFAAAPDLRAIHYLEATLSDECHRLLGPTFRTEIFELRYRVPSYGRWLAGQDRRGPYAYHRFLLRCLLWRRPADRLVLKDPFHLDHLDALAATYPDAFVVRLHRDPAQTIPSACGLTRTIRAARAPHVDLAEIGRYWLARTTASVERTMASGTPLTILDVRYRDLVRDPVAVATRVCAFAGVPAGAAATARMAAYVRANPAGRHGTKAYRAETFHLDPAELDHRFTAYRAAVGL
jgi:hypothetical protein